MKINQAQIEAAAKEIEKYRGLNQTAETLAKAALTAAAEVGYDPELDDITIRLQLERIRTLEAELATTIERCAQVADKMANDMEKDWLACAARLRMAAAAIRALIIRTQEHDEIATTSFAINRQLSDASLRALSLGGKAIMERMSDLEALTAAPKADVRFREFGNGATWVDFPMTQDSAQTTPTQAQIEAANFRSLLERCLKVAMSGQWRDKAKLSVEAHPVWDDVRAALAAAAEVREPLQDEPCPELAREMREAHKRKVARTAAAEAGEHSAIDAFNKGYKQAWDNATAATIELCAQVAHDCATGIEACRKIRAIRTTTGR